ncbi:hypothetical protein PF011_g10567 [Phytophthora fragariae]|uniref:Uncharacterized protein n=1 Tax=Phytophthora fragariae TaxID=53985 RepID=A0A6A3KYQ0_9STRA|nr:hypothetical protein PF011_g10567 [Phytophthora fragariae]
MKISWSSQIATLVSLFTSGTLRADAQVPTFLVYENSACEGTPSSVAFYGTNYCSNYNLNQCATDGHYSYSITCAYFSTSYTDTLFADTPYLITQLYTAYCGSLVGAYVWPLNSDECHPMPPITGTVGVEVVLNADNSLTTEYATDNTCDDMNHATKSDNYDRDNDYWWYNNDDRYDRDYDDGYDNDDRWNDNDDRWNDNDNDDFTFPIWCLN